MTCTVVWRMRTDRGNARSRLESCRQWLVLLAPPRMVFNLTDTFNSTTQRVTFYSICTCFPSCLFCTTSECTARRRCQWVVSSSRTCTSAPTCPNTPRRLRVPAHQAVGQKQLRTTTGFANICNQCRRLNCTSDLLPPVPVAVP